MLSSSPAKMCVVGIAISFIVQSMFFPTKFKASIKGKYLLVDEQNNIICIPENLLHLLIPFVQNLACFPFGVNFLPKKNAYMTPSC